MNTYSFIDALKNRALRGMPVSRDEVLRLLALAPDSEEAAYLGRAARDIAHIVVGNEGRERHRHRLPPLLDELRVLRVRRKVGPDYGTA